MNKSFTGGIIIVLLNIIKNSSEKPVSPEK